MLLERPSTQAGQVPWKSSPSRVSPCVQPEAAMAAMARRGARSRIACPTGTLLMGVVAPLQGKGGAGKRAGRLQVGPADAVVVGDVPDDVGLPFALEAPGQPQRVRRGRGLLAHRREGDVELAAGVLAADADHGVQLGAFDAVVADGLLLV